jgi:hypothetical protein
MRTSTRLPALAACALVPALLLTGCAGDADGTGATDDPTTITAPPATSAPSPSAPGTTTPSVATDLTTTDLLPETAWDPPGGPREESAGVVAWRLPESCAAGAPEGAAAVRTAVHGDGEYEAQIGVQQVAVLPDADAAVAEAHRLAAAFDACAAGATAAEGGSAYVRETVEVGAQGAGLATAYTAVDEASLDGALGSYLAVTRRGAAVTLVALEGGESTVGAARESVTARAQEAWALLCRYDAAGC